MEDIVVSIAVNVYVPLCVDGFEDLNSVSLSSAIMAMNRNDTAFMLRLRALAGEQITAVNKQILARFGQRVLRDYAFEVQALIFADGFSLMERLAAELMAPVFFGDKEPRFFTNNGRRLPIVGRLIVGSN